MMVSLTAALLVAGAAVSQVQAQTVPTDLVGTWTSKANSTMTGDGFYDPVNEKFTEPTHPGIAYSFTADGFFEESYYRAVANPTNPKCPKGIIQWQHGSFSKTPTGNLTLNPIKVDGRQMYSDPCSYEHSVYTRYNATEQFQRYEVLTDPYHKIPRLNLYKHDGSPVMPLYLAFSSPKMLPTTTLNPLITQTAAANKVKRGDLPMNHEVVYKRTSEMERAALVWWAGALMTAGGGALYFFF